MYLLRMCLCIYFCAAPKITLTHSLTQSIGSVVGSFVCLHTCTHHCKCLARTAMPSIKHICRVYSLCLCVWVQFFRFNLTIFQKSKYAETVFCLHTHIHTTPSTHQRSKLLANFCSIVCAYTHTACLSFYVHTHTHTDIRPYSHADKSNATLKNNSHSHTLTLILTH